MNEQGYDILKDELTKNEGSFSKTTNFMLAFDLMSKGEELTGVPICFGPHRKSYTKGCVKMRASQQ